MLFYVFKFMVSAYDIPVTELGMYIFASVADPGRFFSDPDPDPRIRF